MLIGQFIGNLTFGTRDVAALKRVVSIFGIILLAGRSCFMQRQYIVKMIRYALGGLSYAG